MSMHSSWVRMQQTRNDLNDQQPFRCVECGEAVSYIRKNLCACLRGLKVVLVARVQTAGGMKQLRHVGTLLERNGDQFKCQFGDVVGWYDAALLELADKGTDR